MNVTERKPVRVASKGRSEVRTVCAWEADLKEGHPALKL